MVDIVKDINKERPFRNIDSDLLNDFFILLGQYLSIASKGFELPVQCTQLPRIQCIEPFMRVFP